MPKEFIEAAAAGNLDILEELIASKKVDINYVGTFPPSKWKHTALSIATLYNRRNVVEYLLQNGANVETPNLGYKEHYNSVLMMAAAVYEFGSLLDVIQISNRTIFRLLLRYANNLTMRLTQGAYFSGSILDFLASSSDSWINEREEDFCFVCCEILFRNNKSLLCNIIKINKYAESLADTLRRYLLEIKKSDKPITADEVINAYKSIAYLVGKEYLTSKMGSELEQILKTELKLDATPKNIGLIAGHNGALDLVNALKQEILSDLSKKYDKQISDLQEEVETLKKQLGNLAPQTKSNSSESQQLLSTFYASNTYSASSLKN